MKSRDQLLEYYSQRKKTNPNTKKYYLNEGNNKPNKNSNTKINPNRIYRRSN